MHDSILVRILSLVFAAAIGTTLCAQGPAKRKPWRLQELIDGPEFLKVSGELRFRFEGSTGQFRSASRLDDNDQLAFTRTLLKAVADFEPVDVTLELIDGRHYGGSRGSALNASAVDTLDVLQASVDIDVGSGDDSTSTLRIGRQTIDLGGRRLVARNNFRNTINAFTGVNWVWDNESRHTELFWTMPVRRRPSDLASIVDNDLDEDDQDDDFQFFGGFLREKLEHHEFEVYAYAVTESGAGSRRRQLLTPGVRFRRPKQQGEFDYEFEAIYQTGDSRLSSTGADLDHSAWFPHASLGYTFEGDYKPRVRVAFDYASGDRDPGDGDNQRFDTLFGARRFEYGPTSTYGAIARSNIISPDIRLELKPGDYQFLVAWRGLWLASEQDTWTTARVTDATGASGRHVGQQFETRFRWDVVPKGLRLEAGAAYMFDGGFQARAPGGQNTDSFFGYFQAIWKF